MQRSQRSAPHDQEHRALRTLQLRALSALGLSIASSTACGLVDPTFEEPGLIIFYGDTAQVLAPDSVIPGVPFEVSIPTFAGGCTRTIARTEVTVIGMLAVIQPYNETRRSSGCTDDLIILTHVATVQFGQPGAASILVVGEQCPFQGSGVRTGLAVLEHRLIAQ
jgi:hypothetical protein